MLGLNEILGDSDILDDSDALVDSLAEALDVSLGDAVIEEVGDGE
jgi:hypothetical protein